MKKLLGTKKVSCTAMVAIIAAMSLGAPAEVFADSGVNLNKGQSKVEQGQSWVISDIFPDENLALGVSKLFNKDVNDVVTYDELNSIKVASFDKMGIKSLEGVQYFGNLEILNAIENDIKDLTPINKLDKLRIIRLFGNKISDLTPLANGNLKSLGHTYLAGNDIRDPSPLAELPSLQTASLYMNHITDLSAFKDKYVAINATNQTVYLDDVGVGDKTSLTIKGQVDEKMIVALHNDGDYNDGELVWNRAGDNSLRFLTTSGQYFNGRVMQTALNKWKSGTIGNPVEYKQGDKLLHNGKKYVVNIAHSNYGDMNWAPDVALNLFNEIK